MIRPVCIEYTNLGNGRITLFRVAEIVLDMKEILKGHCKIQTIIEFL